MKKMINFLAVLLLSTIFYACNGGGGSGGRAPSVLPNTTILVYIIGTDLQSDFKQGLGNIIEMESVGSTANMNVILQTGGANESNGAQKINWTHNQRWKVLKGSLQPLTDLGMDGGVGGNMGTESTFSDFISWGVKTYPAQKYLVILWDHGGGINSGIGSDSITGSTISVPSIANALNSVAQAQNIKFEIAGFDACLMATAEVASSLVPSSKYMAASEDVEPGGGWAYKPFLEYVTANPNATGAQIGTVIADSYAVKMVNQSITLSITDLSKMAALKTATNEFAKKILKYTQESNGSWKQIAQARISSLDFSTSAIMGETSDLVDMQQFVGNAVKNINRYFVPDAELTAAGDALAEAINNAVIYKVSTQGNDGATGLAVYFPSILATYPSKNYATNTMVNGQPFFAVNYTESSDAGVVAAYYNYYFSESRNLIAAATAPVNTAGVISSIVNNDYNYILAAHRSNNCGIYFSNDQETVSAVPCYDAMILTESSQSSGSGYSITFNKATAGESWITIDGTPAVVIPETAVAKMGESSYNLYSIPVYAKYSDGYSDSVGYLALEQKPDGNFVVKGFQSGTTTPGKTTTILKGWEYALAAYAESNSSYSFYRTNQVVTAGDNGSFSIGYAAINGGKFSFIVNDLTGAVNVSQSVAY